MGLAAALRLWSGSADRAPTLQVQVQGQGLVLCGGVSMICMINPDIRMTSILQNYETMEMSQFASVGRISAQVVYLLSTTIAYTRTSPQFFLLSNPDF